MPNIDFDFVAMLFCAVVLPLIVVLNLLERNAPKTELSRYMWTEQPLLWSLGLIFLSVLALMSIVEVLAAFGLLPAGSVDRVAPVLGVPMALLVLALVVLGARAGYQVWRSART